VTSAKKPGVAFWATVLVVVGLVAYPLSWGPSCWLYWKLGGQTPPDWMGTVMDVYYPVWWASENGPDWFRLTVRLYLDWWVL
jgi:hypothetical protein